MQTISIVFHKDYFWPLEDFKNGAIGLFLIRQSFSIIVSFPQHLNIFSESEKTLNSFQSNHFAVGEI